MDYNIINMNELGRQVGAEVSIERMGGRDMEFVHWTLDTEHKALAALTEQAKNGRPFRFEGHPSKWLLTAMCRALQNNGVIMYIPMLDAETPLKPYRIGTENDGVSTFQVREDGDRVFITYKFKDMKPDEMHRTIVPPIPAGKDVYIRSTRHPILNAVCMALSYADASRSVWVTPDLEDDYYVCAVTNTDAYSLGQEAKIQGL